ELGLGYANLGAHLMSLGLPYDSDAGREYAGAITALMCGEAYLQSAAIAGALGPYAGYATNREPQLRVNERHRAHAHTLDWALGRCRRSSTTRSPGRSAAWATIRGRCRTSSSTSTSTRRSKVRHGSSPRTYRSSTVRSALPAEYEPSTTSATSV